MKKYLLAFIIAPLFCFAMGNFETFKKFDGPPKGDSFIYAGVQSTLDRVLGNVGVRYQDEMFGFDATIAGAPSVRSAPPVLFVQASALLYPWEETLYAGIGPGVSLSLGEAKKVTTLLGVTLGVDYETENATTYFAEGTFLAPADFQFENIAKYPGFRIGVGF